MSNKEYLKAKVLIERATDSDQRHLYGEAYHCYIEAIDKLMALKDCKSSEIKEKIKNLIERAEAIKPLVSRAAEETVRTVTTKLEQINLEIQQKNPQTAEKTLQSALKTLESDKMVLTTSQNDYFVDQLTLLNKKISSLKESENRPGESYSPHELTVLRESSLINKIKYVPFLNFDYKDFAGKTQFFDKNGDLKLSKHQLVHFVGWRRPSELTPNPKMMTSLSFQNIRQSVVSDCSFISSLIVAAQYQGRFRRPLLSGIILPQSNGRPVYSPTGKFVFRLHINGVWRKVIIDDRLPVMVRGQLLCAFTDDDYWVPLLEKAYMKVMGGYDFPGSNSSIDLNALTGWIPERITIDEAISKDLMTLRRMIKHHNSGNCLITAASGDVHGQLGIVPRHSYSVLRIAEVKTTKDESLVMLRLRNPWAEKCWRGRYSRFDSGSWTPLLKRELNYDPSTCEDEGTGEFWIDLDSLKRFFNVFYLSWSPGIFPHSTCLHDTWSMEGSPKKDRVSIGANPQFHLLFTADSKAVVWILLSRHITEIDDFANNKRFVTIDVYRNSSGRRLYLTNDPKPYKSGVRINSPHYLCQLHEDPGDHSLTLVVSEFEKCAPIYFTLRVYSSVAFSLRKIEDNYNHRQHVVGEWKPSGGCPKHVTYQNNPKYRLVVGGTSARNDIVVELRAPISLGVAVELRCDSFVREPSVYFQGYCVEDIVGAPCGLYSLVVSTFLPNQTGTFILNIKSTAPINIQ